MLPFFTFNHIGVACYDIDKTADIYLNAGYQRTDTIIDPLQNVKVCVLTKESMPTVELLAPVDDMSPICKTLQKSGVSPYHICYNVPNMEQAIKELRAKKFMPVSKPKMSNVFNSMVCFLFHKEIGLIEILEKSF